MDEFFQVRLWPGSSPGQDIYTKTPDLYLPQQIFMLEKNIGHGEST